MKSWLVLPVLSSVLAWSPLVQAATDCAQVTEIPQSECEALIALLIHL